jgi:hypothetical protein
VEVHHLRWHRRVRRGRFIYFPDLRSSYLLMDYRAYNADESAEGEHVVSKRARVEEEKQNQ